MKSNTALKLATICVICAASMFSGCMESTDPESTESDYDTIPSAPTQTPAPEPTVEATTEPTIETATINMIKYEGVITSTLYYASGEVKYGSTDIPFSDNIDYTHAEWDKVNITRLVKDSGMCMEMVRDRKDNITHSNESVIEGTTSFYLDAGKDYMGVSISYTKSRYEVDAPVYTIDDDSKTYTTIVYEYTSEISEYDKITGTMTDPMIQSYTKDHPYKEQRWSGVIDLPSCIHIFGYEPTGIYERCDTQEDIGENQINGLTTCRLNRDNGFVNISISYIKTRK